MRILIFVSALLFIQAVQQSPNLPEQPEKTGGARKEIQTQVPTLPSSPNPVSGAVAAPPTKNEQANAANRHDDPHHSITYLNAISTVAIAIFSFLTWRVYRAQLHATKINERAWIVPAVGKIEPTKDPELFQITVELKNNGKTPAWITAAGSNGKGATEQKPLPAKPPYDEMKPFSKKGSLLSPTAFLPQGFPLPKERLDDVQAGRSQLFIFGYAAYRDVYGDTHIVRYCFEARKSEDVNHPHPLEFYVGGPSEYMDAD